MLYSVKSTNLPARGTPGDTWYTTDTRQTFIVLNDTRLYNLAGLLAPNTQNPVVGPQGPQGLTGSPGQSITWRGAYDPGNSYAPYDFVSYNGSTYICIQQVGANSGNAPGNTEYWNLVAQSGDGGPVTSIGQDSSGAVNAINGEPIAAQSVGGLTAAQITARIIALA
jgi:hypothetical protein